MKDILKVLGIYFALGLGTVSGIGAGMKVCDMILNRDSNKPEKLENCIRFTKESK